MIYIKPSGIFSTPLNVILLLVASFLNTAYGSPLNEAPENTFIQTFWSDVLKDYSTHYSKTELVKLGGLIGLAGVMANTEIDESLRQNWQRQLRSDFTDRSAKKVDQYSQFPQIRVVLPIYLSVIWLGYHSSDPILTWFGQWGYHSIRTLLLGAPQQALFNAILGAKRPEEGTSKWHFYGEGRSVSGHAFYGAVPLVNAARLSEPWALKGLLYGLSIVPTLSRINADKHYASQVLLGWGLACLATHSVAKSQEKYLNQAFSLSAYPYHNGAIIALSWKF